MTPPDLARGCHRSHPHERMNEVCELKTEIARLRNALAQSVETVRRLLAANKQDDTMPQREAELMAETARLKKALKTTEWICREIVAWGMQTQTDTLDLTTAEFGEIWRAAQQALDAQTEKEERR